MEITTPKQFIPVDDDEVNHTVGCPHCGHIDTFAGLGWATCSTCGLTFLLHGQWLCDSWGLKSERVEPTVYASSTEIAEREIKQALEEEKINDVTFDMWFFAGSPFAEFLKAINFTVLDVRSKFRRQRVVRKINEILDVMIEEVGDCGFLYESEFGELPSGKSFKIDGLEKKVIVNERLKEE
jgi:hypothetical protein